MTFVTATAFILVTTLFLLALIRLSFLIWFAIVHPHEVLADYGRDWFDEEERVYTDPFEYEPMYIEILDREEAYDEQS